MDFALSDFRPHSPPYQLPQREALAWLAVVHAQAESARRPDAQQHEAFRRQLERRLRRVGCGPDQIESRGYEVADCGHEDWDRMSIFDVTRRPAGAGAAERGACFSRAVDRFFDATYAEESKPPIELIHVTCTGYVAPSGAQKIVQRKRWGSTTRVTHAYHMGCYAAFPALRIAAGQLALTPDATARVDVAHTEVCSLHVDPTDHSDEQLVVQSLFSDGYVRYAVRRSGAAEGPRLRIIALREELLADSEHSMGWACSDHAMRMTLGRDVPERIGAAVGAFMRALFADAGMALHEHRAATTFAIHPGGPRIVDIVRDRLELTEAQVALGRAVLRDHGNMSSATLPYVWMRALASEAVPTGALVASLAFGPGLTCCGGLFRKE